MPVPNFGGADFKSDICFQKILIKIPKFEYFGPKSIGFLILTRFSDMTLATQTNSIYIYIYIYIYIFILQVIWKKTFRFFTKVSKYCGLNYYFLKVLIENMTKQLKHLLSVTIFRFQEMKWMRNQVLKSYSKGANIWVTY